MQIYSVGGAVRDRLMGVVPNDRDWVVVGGTEQQMIALGYVQVGKSFPVFLNPITKEEYALARKERKTGVGHMGFGCDTEGVSLIDDLSRRDITINAIAEDFEGNIIDPFSGQQDIVDQVIRHVSPAFAEDPLRVLRVARFVARLNFSVDPSTVDLCKQLVASGELLEISLERIRDEMVKLYSAPHYANGLKFLREVGGQMVPSLAPYLADDPTIVISPTAPMIVRLAVSGNFTDVEQLDTATFSKFDQRIWGLCNTVLKFDAESTLGITPGQLACNVQKISPQLWASIGAADMLRAHVLLNTPEIVQYLDDAMKEFSNVDKVELLKDVPLNHVRDTITECRLTIASNILNR